MEIKEVALESIHIRPDWDLKLREDLMQIYKIADSIKEYGQLVPIVCWKMVPSQELQLLSGATIYEALRRLGRKTAFITVANAMNEQDALKIWSALNLNERPINYIEFSKKVKQYPEIKRAIAKQTVMLQEEIDSIENLLDFDWSCFAKAKERTEGPDMFGGLFDGTDKNNQN